MSLFLHRFKGKALYLLDEPESALSPSRQLVFQRVLRELTDRQAQFIIATHSPILLGYPDATIYRFDEEKITDIEYDMPEHVQITKYFLLNREKILEELWKDER
ncbi:MAG: ABC transporter, ATP-binding protein [Candidatus Carbobacillus altaicus]|uniref:ABC transporter, ATP-binding protein n=1 Tax=Candidatus Carbonibacillus altaicus TaxID=2163959 RepID=A0A2R6Y0G3_9BACL|nr:MAG: ABC transporter, ATP-binding protein [Candidatus Carbobacillus altaicus]